MVNSITGIRKICKSQDIKDILISSSLVKQSIDGFNNSDRNKGVCNESLDPESNSQNQELNLNLNSDLDLDDLLKVKETYANNLLTGYRNINSVRNKFSALTETLVKNLHIFYTSMKTKLDSSLPEAQFKIDRYQFSLFRTDRNAKGGSKIVFIRHGLIVKSLEIFETKTAETVCIELNIFKKKWFILLFF